MNTDKLESHHEMHNYGHYLPVKPVPPPTQAQQLAFALTDLAKCKARLHRMRGKALELKMWLDMQEVGRAKEAVNAIVLDL